ncbi:uncharacterized protein HMPREF1541_08782 [Cyphellophora europaea CBS 101466]|uniref:F-box domain-containing protein n=1 Tax=Cyphellophora europaea (strain CBS 101466) TaxID=1220924 RepID=W2RL99_CYPE1|nr:uncharacterized protein HMPREF1541_08782 [Cyphellophora europaea CBS 101466]ETN36504.1 hypothetical protein HMPREF1541_08782 [Cyphellophora europaea CBS 101466]
MLAQEDSGLFQLPIEIRNRIFEYALEEDDDLLQPFGHDRLYFRPDRRCPQVIQLFFLRACKRAYQETRAMPVSLADHTIWLAGGPYRLLPNSRGATGKMLAWQESLNREQRAAVRRIRLYTESLKLHELPLVSDLHAGQVSLVVRASRASAFAPHMWSYCPQFFALCPWLPGYCFPEMMSAQPQEPDMSFLRSKMDETTWGGRISQIEGLEKFRLELEAPEHLKDDFEAVLARAKYWRFPISGSFDALLPTGEVRRWSWKGYAEPRADHEASLTDEAVALLPQTTYMVAEISWIKYKDGVADYI